MIIDLRPSSPTLRRLARRSSSPPTTAGSLYIPEGFAHGFQTLDDHTEVFYQMAEFYAPDYARGVRWDDPAFGIVWPETPRVISGAGSAYLDFGI